MDGKKCSYRFSGLIDYLLERGVRLYKVVLYRAPSWGQLHGFHVGAIDGRCNFQERPGSIVLPFAKNISHLLDSVGPVHLAVDLMAI